MKNQRRKKALAISPQLKTQQKLRTPEYWNYRFTRSHTPLASRHLMQRGVITEENYKYYTESFERYALTFFLKCIEQNNIKRIIDVGFGAGDASHYIPQAQKYGVKTITIVDICTVGVNNARAYIENLQSKGIHLPRIEILQLSLENILNWRHITEDINGKGLLLLSRVLHLYRKNELPAILRMFRWILHYYHIALIHPQAKHNKNWKSKGTYPSNFEEIKRLLEKGVYDKTLTLLEYPHTVPFYEKTYSACLIQLP